jgi:restriction system protein
LIIFITALTGMFSILYPFWLLIPLLGLRRLLINDRPFLQRIRCGIGDIFIFWLIWAFFWGFVNWQGRQPALILPKSTNDFLFMTVGAISGTITLFWIFNTWRKERIKLSKIKKLGDLQQLTPDGFETLIAKLFTTNGYAVDLTGGSADHGVDIVVWNDEGEKWIVQCKRYSGSVGEPVVRDLYGTMLHEEAQGAYLMTTGTLTDKAQEWAQGKPIMLYDGEALVELVRRVQPRG